MTSLPRRSLLACALLILACKSSPSALDGGTDATAAVVTDVAAAEALPADATGASVDAAPPIDALTATDATAAGACATSLSGTWDLIAAAPGNGLHGGVLELGRDAFSLMVEGKRLTYTLANKQAMWVGAGGLPRSLTIQNTPGAVSAGTLPLSVGGQWAFDGDSERCELSVAPASVSGKCRSLSGDDHVGGSDWPNSLPNPLNGRTYLATRTAPLPSRFGDLGGRWQARATPDSPAECQVTVSGNDVTFVCHDANVFNGTTKLTIGDDCVGSGTSSGGFELGARRR